MIVMLQKFQLIPIKTECARAVPVGYLPLAEHAKERTFLRGAPSFKSNSFFLGQTNSKSENTSGILGQRGYL